jgi:hypothetical protein
MLMIWIGFFCALSLLIFVARQNLWLGLLVGALILGIFNLPVFELLKVIGKTLSDLSILLLAMAVGLIPVLGAALEVSGLMQRFFQSLRMPSHTFLMVSPAFFGMLPMPGGALLSAPLIARAGKDIHNADYTAINVWFRHVFIIIYPLGNLLVTTKMAGLNLYREILYMIPGFFLLAGLGYIFLIRRAHTNTLLRGKPNLRATLLPMIIILAAPLIHLTLMSLLPRLIPEIPLLIGVSVSLILAAVFGRLSIRQLIPIAQQTKAWKYSLIILGMFLFLNIFKASEVSKALATVIFSKTFLLVGVGIFLGFVTGRVQVPFSILLPIYYSKYGNETMTPLVFGVAFFAIFVAYIISPIHPCLSVTLEYFHTSFKEFYQRITAPAIIAFAAVLVLALIFIG